MSEREAMEFDVVIVGAGPAGLAAAIRLKQLAPEATVCVVEKGGEVGAHILSGAVIEPRALDELLPDWKERGAPLTTAGRGGPLPVPDRQACHQACRRRRRCTTTATTSSPSAIVVPLARASRPRRLGVEIYPGFAASELLEEDGRIVGVATGDMGVEKDGEHGGNYQPGMELRATYTLFGEGCRGSLTKKLMPKRFNLRDGRDPPTYALGIKELWEVPAERA